MPKKIKKSKKSISEQEVITQRLAIFDAMMGSIRNQIASGSPIPDIKILILRQPQ
jgi:hypothetical protein